MVDMPSLADGEDEEGWTLRGPGIRTQTRYVMSPSPIPEFDNPKMPWMSCSLLLWEGIGVLGLCFGLACWGAQEP
ncbi:hypothetical protein GCM10023165_16660 [Variovorax defluvii]|uniref:Uncharacterized protein n=1 Tax=Variovorax defluvii TaxID=913761 RepID=A0ABP8HEA0_9BURK